MSDLFNIFMGIEEKEEQPPQKSVTFKQSKNKRKKIIKKIRGVKEREKIIKKNTFQNEEPLKFENDKIGKKIILPTNLYFTNKIMTFGSDEEKKKNLEEENKIVEEKNKKLVDKEKKRNYKVISNIRKKNKKSYQDYENNLKNQNKKNGVNDITKKVDDNSVTTKPVKKIENKKKRKEASKKSRVWKAQKCGPNLRTLNLKKDYQERNYGVYKKRKKNPYLNKFKKFTNPQDLIPDFNINMIASAEIHITELFRARTEEINKDNLYFKFMNESVQWLLLKNTDLSEEHKKKYLLNLANLKKNKEIICPDPITKRKILQENFKYDNFYPFQKKALEILEKKNKKLIINSFTGSGKSLIYQFNALTKKGLTIVLIPYISIIVDQIQKAPKMISTLTLNSWLSYPQKKKFRDMILENNIKLVFMTPEMFLGEFFVKIIEKEDLDISMVCIDETHCAVPWDVSFRVSYICLAQALEKLRQKKKDMNCLFLTATADKNAVDFLRNEFDIDEGNYITTKNYIRVNSEISFKKCSDQNFKILSILRNKYYNKKPILIFCNFKKSAEALSTYLKGNGVNSFTFHGDLTEIQKLTVLHNLILKKNDDEDNMELKKMQNFKKITEEDNEEEEYFARLRKNNKMKLEKDKNVDMEIENFAKKVEINIVNQVLLKKNTMKINKEKKQKEEEENKKENKNKEENKKKNKEEIKKKEEKKKENDLKEKNDIKKSYNLADQMLKKKKEQSDLSKIFSKVEVIIATLSLSMGLDVPNIKGVIHYNFPKFLESYIQQIGRSGRNGKISECVVLLNKNDFYFSRNKTISNFFIDKKSIFFFIDYIIQQTDNFFFITKDFMKNKFFFNKSVYKEILSVVNIVLKKIGYELEIFYNFNNKVNLKCYSKKNIFFEHFNGKKKIDLKELYPVKEDLEIMEKVFDFLQKCKKNKSEILFTFSDLINNLKEIPVEKIIILTKRLENLEKVAFIRKGTGLLIRSKKKIENSEKENILEKISEKLKEYLQKQLFKIDVFYFLSNYVQNQKNSEKGQKIFKILTSEYFEKENSEFKKNLIENYNFKSFCPIIYITTKKQFSEVKSIFSDFFSENYNFIIGLLKESTNYYEVYADCLRFLLGVSNMFFKSFKWDHPFCGALKFYAFEEFYLEIENIFKISFKNLHNPVDLDFEEESNKKIC